MGRFFIFIIIVSIALVLGHGLSCHSLLKGARILPRCAARTTGGRKDYIPTASRTALGRRARAFIHGGFGGVCGSRHLSS